MQNGGQANNESGSDAGEKPEDNRVVRIRYNEGASIALRLFRGRKPLTSRCVANRAARARGSAVVFTGSAVDFARQRGAKCHQDHQVYGADLAAEVDVGAVPPNCERISCSFRSSWRASSCASLASMQVAKLVVSRIAMYRTVASCFLVCAQLIGTYAPNVYQSPIEPWSTLVTLIIVMSITSVINGLEDIQRAKSDRQENTAEVIVCHFANGQLVEERIASEHVRPGDILKVRDGTSVPADMVILWTSMNENSNQCYIETSNIDGETNLKMRQASSGMLMISEPQVELPASICAAEVEVEPPNRHIHRFVGTLSVEGVADKMPLSEDNILLRGSMLSNTDWYAFFVLLFWLGPSTNEQLRFARADAPTGSTVWRSTLASRRRS
jgi:hypothetical protein